MTDLRELYQQVILDHNKRPRNFGDMPGASSEVKGHNPLCGDRVTVYVKLDGGRIEDIRFMGTGCAISKASASMMTESLKGLSVEEASRLFERFVGMVTGSETPDLDEMGKLGVFSEIGKFPARVKCATLAWHAVRSALAGSGESITTE